MDAMDSETTLVQRKTGNICARQIHGCEIQYWARERLLLQASKAIFTYNLCIKKTTKYHFNISEPWNYCSEKDYRS